MGVNFLSISLVCTILSLVGIQYWTEISLEKHKSDVLIVNDVINSENATRALELLLGSYTTHLLLASFVLNVIILVILGLKITAWALFTLIQYWVGYSHLHPVGKELPLVEERVTLIGYFVCVFICMQMFIKEQREKKEIEKTEYIAYY